MLGRLGSIHESTNPQFLELRFRALLTEGDARVLSIARRPTSLVGLDREAGNPGAKRAQYLVEFTSFPTWQNSR